MSFTIFWNEKTPFQAIKKRSSKSRKIAFFSKRVNQRFWSKNFRFSNFFFSGNIGQQYVFQDILERKKFFLAYKNKKFKKSKNCLFFPKGLTQGLGPKMAIFPTSFFLGNVGQESVFKIFYNEKTPFQAIKTRSSKSRKIAIFPKGLTHGFRRKMVIFPTSFFLARQARKMSFTTSRTKKHLSRL